jgi:hypothetical protein
VNCVTLGLDLRIMSASLLTAMITSERSVPCKGVSSAKRRPILGPFVSSSFRRTGVLMAHGDECMQKKSFVSVRFVETFSRKRSD